MKKIPRQIPLKAKLAAIAVFPFVVLIFLTIQLYQEQDEKARLLKNFIGRIHRAANINKLIDKLQEEKRYSFDYLMGDRNVPLNHYRERSDSTIKILLQQDDPFFAGFADFTSLAELSSIRNRVDSNTIPQNQLTHFFSNMIFRINTQHTIPYGSYTYLKPVYQKLIAHKLISEIITYLGIIRSNIYNVLYTRQYMLETLAGTLGTHDVLKSFEREFRYKVSENEKKEFDSVSNETNYKIIREYISDLFTSFKFDSSYDAVEWWDTSAKGIGSLQNYQNILWERAALGMNEVYEDVELKKKRTFIILLIILASIVALVASTIYFIHRDAKRLHQRVAEKTQELQQANLDLQKSNQQLEEFAYVASHDLQEPLRKIQTFADVAQQNLNDPELTKKYIDKLSSSAKRMSELINSVLNYSKITSSGKDFERTDLNDLLSSVLSDLELLIADKKAEITSGQLPVVNGIKAQLYQLFYNLINNSLKFSEDHPVINITSGIVNGKDMPVEFSANTQQRYTVIIFADNGIGFDPDYTDQIFTIFQRLHSNHRYAGTGIGLALCKKITENHNGFIRAESQPDKGARFMVYLPV